MPRFHEVSETIALNLDQVVLVQKSEKGSMVQLVVGGPIALTAAQAAELHAAMFRVTSRELPRRRP